jgi:pimeloyl-ACP methyl ester carboxylesterase
LKNLHRINHKELRIAFSNGNICWKVFGNGSKIILAFHGFGQSGEAFAQLARTFSDHTIYCMDLPFHGATTIANKNVALTPSQIVEMANNLIRQEGIGEFSMIGFSIGAKLVFPLIRGLAAQITEVTLIAPDGIKENIWYRMVTGSPAMRRVFRCILQNSRTTDTLITAAKALGIVDGKTAAFAQASLADERSRARVYDIWCYLRKLKLNAAEILHTIHKHRLAVVFVIGEKDRLVPPKSIVGLSAKIEIKKMVRLRGGHYHLIAQYLQSIGSDGGAKP